MNNNSDVIHQFVGTSFNYVTSHAYSCGCVSKRPPAAHAAGLSLRREGAMSVTCFLTSSLYSRASGEQPSTFIIIYHVLSLNFGFMASLVSPYPPSISCNNSRDRFPFILTPAMLKRHRTIWPQ